MIYEEGNIYVLECDCCGNYKLRFKTADDLIDYLTNIKWEIDKDTGEDSFYYCPVCKGKD